MILDPSTWLSKPVAAHPRVLDVLAVAYQRPCLICQRVGCCRHREPEVELAIFGARIAPAPPQVTLLRRAS